MGTNETEEPTSEAAGALAHAAARRDDFSVQALTSTWIADGDVMRELRWSLDALAAQYGQGTDPDAKIALNRPHALALLTSLHTGLRALLARPANLQISHEDDVEIKFEHPTMSLLLDLIDAFSDLDNAKSHAVFDTSHISRGASLTRSEIRKRDEILTLVEVIKTLPNIRTTAAAERKLVEMMRKKSKRSASITVSQLKEMRKTRRKQRSRTKS